MSLRNLFSCCTTSNTNSKNGKTKNKQQDCVNRDIGTNQQHDYCNDHFKKEENADVGNDRNKLLPSCNHHKKKSLNHTNHAARRTIKNCEHVIDKPLNINSNLKAYRIYESNDAGNYAVYRSSYDIQNARIVRRKNNRTSQMKTNDSEEFFSCEEE
ncbi:unnamed protein product [Rotaria magnacalcarata]|nr:unnamed protein product [Rotaria magnacalcarata]CAF3421167.1 unnamed protein product [Rotaria socialis]CAF2013228.1 unnamed protein product [Rotaria magnacalcarata]CAF2086960.1 unnamed protein product [Rotaria magnacalcarata]CAF2127579.1 unnamed protein product [Rotaria magnacalcarata]